MIIYAAIGLLDEADNACGAVGDAAPGRAAGETT